MATGKILRSITFHQTTPQPEHPSIPPTSNNLAPAMSISSSSASPRSPRTASSHLRWMPWNYTMHGDALGCYVISRPNDTTFPWHLKDLACCQMAYTADWWRRHRTKVDALQKPRLKAHGQPISFWQFQLTAQERIGVRASLNINNLGYIYKREIYTSSTAQGGGGSFKDRKPIGEIGCCDAWMAEQSHRWIERWLERRPVYLSIYLPV